MTRDGIVASHRQVETNTASAIASGFTIPLYTAPEQVEGIDELTRQRDKLLVALTEIAELDVLKYHHAYAIAKSAIEEVRDA